MNINLNKIISPKSSEQDGLWRDYHENSKTERHHRPPSSAEVRSRMAEQVLSLEYKGYPSTDLPAPARVETPLSDVIAGRHTARQMAPGPVTLDELSALLFAAYGENRDNTGNEFPRPFRVIPSGGALYPLEIYFHTTRVEGLDAGLYHYNPHRNSVARLIRGDLTHKLCQTVAQTNIPLDASVMIFVTALFQRTSFKYGERSYRFALIECGHMMQNLCLMAQGLGMGAAPVGGFFDREVDQILGIDGVNHATLYLAAIGRDAEADAGT